MGGYEGSQIDEGSSQHIFNLLLKYTSQQNSAFSNQKKNKTFYWADPLTADFRVAAQIAPNSRGFLDDLFKWSPLLSVELFQAIFTTEHFITQLS